MSVADRDRQGSSARTHSSLLCNFPLKEQAWTRVVGLRPTNIQASIWRSARTAPKGARAFHFARRAHIWKMEITHHFVVRLAQTADGGLLAGECEEKLTAMAAVTSARAYASEKAGALCLLAARRPSAGRLRASAHPRRVRGTTPQCRGVHSGLPSAGADRKPPRNLPALGGSLSQSIKQALLAFRSAKARASSLSAALGMAAFSFPRTQPARRIRRLSCS